MRKCLFVALIQHIEFHNQRGKDKLNTPEIQPLTEGIYLFTQNLLYLSFIDFSSMRKKKDGS